MIKIDAPNREVRISLNRFYPLWAVRRAICAFSDICDIRSGDNEIILKPKSGNVELDIAGYEFLNYVAGLVASETGETDER